MKLICTLAVTVSAAATAMAAEPLFVPPPSEGYALFQTPVPESQPLPAPSLGAPGSTPPEMTPLPSGPAVTPPVVGAPGKLVPLYPHVRVINPRKAYPCGVMEVVEVPNPRPLSGCCEPVYVQICVPPGCPPVVTVGPRGQRITYSFGGYRVQVTSLRGVVTIDYDRI